MRAAFGHYPAIRVWQVLVQTTLVFFCLTRLLSAQTISEGGDGYIIDVWQTDDGLPENEVTSIAQTPEGYLWIGLFHGGLALRTPRSQLGTEAGSIWNAPNNPAPGCDWIRLWGCIPTKWS